MRRGLEYPGVCPDFPYLLVGDQHFPLARVDSTDFAEGRVVSPQEEVSVSEFLARRGLPESAWEDERFAVVSYGANRVPSILAKKLAGCGDRVVFVLPAVLCDADIVFAAHVTVGGIVPSTAMDSPGARARVMVTFFSAEQLPFIHRSESLGVNYDFGTVPPTRVDGPKGVDQMHMYVALSGRLMLDGGAVALAAIETQGRSVPSMTEVEVMTTMARRYGQPTPQDMVTAIMDDSVLRTRINDELLSEGLPLSLLGFEGIGE